MSPLRTTGRPIEHDHTILAHEGTTLKQGVMTFSDDGLAFEVTLKGQAKAHAIIPRYRTVVLKG